MSQLPYFIKSAYFEKDYPPNSGVEFAFLGASNSGKSSLINGLLQKKLCHTSSKPGHTSTINFIQYTKEIMMVDLPGYGYAKRSDKEQKKWKKAIDMYLTERESLSLCYLLFDLKRGLLENDIKLVEYLIHLELPFVLVATKVDKLTQKEQSQMKRRLKEQVGDELDVLMTSSLKGRGLKDIILHMKSFVN